MKQSIPHHFIYDIRSYVNLLLISFIAVSSQGCGETSKRNSGTPLQAVEFVDLDKYLGDWYEIARFPFSIQDGCFGSQANYSKKNDGNISIINKCNMGAFDGQENVAEGKAWVVDKKYQAKLKISFNFFMGLFGGGDYWITHLAPDYSYSVVSEPQGRYLWILSRTKKMDEDLYSEIVQKLKNDGYQVEYLQKTPQQG